MKDVWIQLVGVTEPFTVPVEDNCFVDKLRKAVLVECSNTLKGIDSKDLVVYANKKTYEGSQRGEEDASPMKGSQVIGKLGEFVTDPIFVTATLKTEIFFIQASSALCVQNSANMIDLDSVHLPRTELLEAIYNLFTIDGLKFVTLSSSSGSGKSSLLQLFTKKYENEFTSIFIGLKNRKLTIED